MRISVIAAVVCIGVLCGYLLSWILFKPIASGVARSQVSSYGDVPSYDRCRGIQLVETTTECILTASEVYLSFRLLMVPIFLS